MFISGYQEAHPEKTKVAAGLVSTHRVDERERLRTLEYVHLFRSHFIILEEVMKTK